MQKSESHFFSPVCKWIGSGRNTDVNAAGGESPSLRLRKTFFLPHEVRNAVCRICGLGCYVLRCNGKRVGDDVLSPAFTDYNRRVLYVEYDLGEYLVSGENTLAVELGNGFYNQGTDDVWEFFRATWRDEVKLLLEVTVNGETVSVSDETWKCAPGATVHNEIRTGEYYDARLEDGWENAGFDDSAWENAKIVVPPKGRPEKSELPPIRECGTVSAVWKWKSADGWVFDFGKNIAGYAELCLQGHPGETAVIRYAEKLNGEEIDQSNISCFVKGPFPFSEDHYTFRGDGTERWKPKFVYHGFRYAELSGLTEEPPLSALTAYFVHTDLKKTGSFSCSDDLMNWIFEAGNRSFLSNFHGFSEDCPHREKNGWTGDAAISADYAVALYDMKSAYHKWLNDISDAQRENGQLPGIAPTAGYGYDWGSGPAWDCALFFLPYALYRETGDRDCLLSVYGTMKRYLSYAATKREDALVCYGLADWCPPSGVDDLRLMDNRLSDSCYYYRMLQIGAEVAGMQGEESVRRQYLSDAEKTREAIRNKYVNGDHVDNDGQGALAEVLYFRIVEGEEARRIAGRLAETVTADGYRFKTGILGTKALLNALAEYGYAETAYRMLDRYDYPSYGYWRNLGATTLWENWDGTESRNHHMYADAVHWIFRNIGGVQNAGIAYDRCVLKPYFFAGDCSAKTCLQTSRGELAFDWEKRGDEMSARIVLPGGTSCILQLPGEEPLSVTSGEYRFRLK